MILWHLGTAAAIVYVTLGRQRIDYRFILIGAVLPDVIDGILGLFVFDDGGGGPGRWIAHSLMADVAVTVAIILLLSGAARQRWFGIGVGWLLHLVCDGMWDAPKTFFWPIAGTDFSPAPKEPYTWDLFVHPLAHWTTWAAELVGLALLAWFWVAFSLGRDGRFKTFLGDGYLRPDPTEYAPLR
ncbi:MAG TPA: metal-dependent hydrolase [Actinomycetota bacterium]|nr:metal-dependent hydrolase [Actinomycetota bacterium]